MNTITIERNLLEQALESMCWAARTLNIDPDEAPNYHRSLENIRAALAAPNDVAEEMSAVADQYAHKLALDLECVLADYSGTWYDTAICTLGAYRGAMNAIHERESPTFMGEPAIRPTKEEPAPDLIPYLEALNNDTQKQKEALMYALRAEMARPPTPAWRDAPTCAGLWLCNYGILEVVCINQPDVDNFDDFHNAGGRWYGPIPEDIAKAEGAQNDK